VQQFVDANAGELHDHVAIPEQRHYMRLLIDLNFLRFSRPGPDVHSITENVVAVDGNQLRCRIYRPSGEDRLPAHIAPHGGGWWQGHRRARLRNRADIVRLFFDTDTPTQHLGDQVRDLLPQAGIVSIDERCSAVKVKVLGESTADPEDEPD
jgi:hypothetical protein